MLKQSLVVWGIAACMMAGCGKEEQKPQIQGQANVVDVATPVANTIPFDDAKLKVATAEQVFADGKDGMWRLSKITVYQRQKGHNNSYLAETALTYGTDGKQ